MLSKYVWLISVEKISFVRSCCGSNKSDGLHNKGPHTRGNIKWCSFALRFCVSNPKSAWQPLLPSAKGLSFTLCSYFMFLLYAWVKVTFTFPFFILSFGKLLVFERSWYIYISNWMFVSMDYYCWHHLKVNTLGGNTISPYLSQCPDESP